MVEKKKKKKAMIGNKTMEKGVRTRIIADGPRSDLIADEISSSIIGSTRPDHLLTVLTLDNRGTKTREVLNESVEELGRG